MYHLHIDKKQCDIKKIIDSGQVFRYEEREDSFVLFYKQHVVVVTKSQEGYWFDCTEDEFHHIWHRYLDLDRDYDGMNQFLVKKDPSLKEVIKRQQGIRILRQNPFEMLFTFIVSQSKSMVQIRRLVNEVAEKYGTQIEHRDGHIYYSFPSPEQLSQVTEEDFRIMRYGYRAPYLEAAVKASKQDPFDSEGAFIGNPDDLVRTLMAIKGVGIKVASCVALFGYGKMDAFPVDTWIRKLMTKRYGKKIEVCYGKINDITISRFAHEMYEDYAGIAQQYLFEAREEELKRKI